MYKLNIYACGGFFKAHIDTPRSEKMFGSLVVCLPTPFTGGELIVRHHKQEIKYDWSSTASDTSSTLHWATFFSDVEHEVLPVSEGYRVTLTYNLSYQSKASDSTFDVNKYGFYKLLQAILSNPVFMCDGGVLGFNSHYSYVFDIQWADLLTHISSTTKDKADTIRQLNRKVPCDKFIYLSKDQQVKILADVGIEDTNCKIILDALPSDFPLLKGADYIVVETARSLGLPVCVKPFIISEFDLHNSDFKYGLKDFSQLFPEKDEVEQKEMTYLQMFGDATCRYKPQDITWCQELSHGQPTGAAMAFGNEATLELWYKSAAILIRIPKWSAYRQRLTMISTGECCDEKLETSEPDEDGTIKDFKGIIQDYEDIVQEETQQLLDQVKELLDNKYINEVQGLKDKLKKIKNILKLNRHAKHSNEQVDNICHIKDDLSSLMYYAKSDHPYKLDHLRHTMSGLKSDILKFNFHKKQL